MRCSSSLLLPLLASSLACFGCSSHPPNEREATSGAAISSDGVEVGMPFAGSFDRFAIAGPDDNHHIIYGADWSADIYASSGTAVRFRANVRGRISRLENTCREGGLNAGGLTASVDLLDAAGKKIGAAHYLHLANPRVKIGDSIESGTVLGETKQWASSTCYRVSNDNGTHVHFEAFGTSCWVPSSQTDLAEGAPLARIGTSTPKRRCASATSSKPEPPPFASSPRPTGGPFPALRIASPVAEAGTYVTQCSEDASGERVWTVSASGPERNQRWADARYPQEVSASCGKPTEVHHPLVFRNHAAGEVSGWIGVCVEDGAGTELVFHVDHTVDGHPAASFQFPQLSSECP